MRNVLNEIKMMKQALKDASIAFAKADKSRYIKEGMLAATVVFVAGLYLVSDGGAAEAKQKSKPPSRDPLLTLRNQSQATMPSRPVAPTPIVTSSPGVVSPAPARQQLAYNQSSSSVNQPYAGSTATSIVPDAIANAPTPSIPSANTRVISTEPYVPPTSQNLIEAGINYHHVTNDLGNWFGQFLNVQYQTDAWNRWSLSLLNQQAFTDEGQSIAIGNTHIINEDWYTTAGIAFGTDASFLTKYRVDVALNKKWLEGKNLITTAGLTYSKAQETYDDKGLLLSAVYYTPSPWIIQGGVRFNISDPGSVFSPSVFSALTYGYNKRYFVTGKLGMAREAYQLIGPGAIVNSFNSYNGGLDYRQWLGKDWGFNVGTEYYTNPAYDRLGGTLSVFMEF
ncbi:MAG: YaiO family outer membrane beta-barrel protein [Proteobacteria bacterium]|nr:YaiO family outer membrane beta-barrel protein [Pseudomonadota bacterium]